MRVPDRGNAGRADHAAAEQIESEGQVKAEGLSGRITHDILLRRRRRRNKSVLAN